jgi:hypothetical protein
MTAFRIKTNPFLLLLLTVILVIQSLFTSIQTYPISASLSSSSIRASSIEVYKPFDESLCKDEGVVESSETALKYENIKQKLYHEETIRADSLIPRFLFDDIEINGDGRCALRLGDCGSGLQPHVSIDETPTAFGSLVNCMRLARSIPSSRFCEPTIFHMFWGKLPAAEQAALAIVSFLATQDLEYSVLWVWSPLGVEAASDPLFLPFTNSKHVFFKTFDAIIEARGTPLEGSFLLQAAASSNDPRFYLFGDLVRLLVLAKHGGVYVDMDVLLLRNLGPLLGHEFAEQWDTSCFESNNAVLRIKAGSAFSTNMVSFVAKTDPKTLPSSFSPYAWGGEVALYNNFNFFDRLPVCFIDSLFLLDSFANSSKVHPSNWFGSFAYHLHGSVFRNERQSEDNSAYVQVQGELWTRLRHRDQNLEEEIRNGLEKALKLPVRGGEG